jgi:hypothetical protein
MKKKKKKQSTNRRLDEMENDIENTLAKLRGYDFE